MNRHRVLLEVHRTGGDVLVTDVHRGSVRCTVEFLSPIFVTFRPVDPAGAKFTRRLRLMQ